MKAILLIFAPPIESFVMKLLEDNGIKKYTKFPNLYGVGGHSEPHLDTQVWPGTNIALLIVTDEKTISKIKPGLSALKKEYLEEGVKAFTWTVEEEI